MQRSLSRRALSSLHVLPARLACAAQATFASLWARAQCAYDHELRVKVGYLVALLAVPPLLLGVGALGYMTIEHWSLLDALYMTVITLTTLGFGEVHPMSSAGRIFTMVLSLGGVFTLFSAASSVIALLVSGSFAKVFREARLKKRLDALEGHVIVCGAGRMGRFVVHAVQKGGTQVVAIDRHHVVQDGSDLAPALVLTGDASSDEILLRAGIVRARALVAALGSDVDNVFLTLSARSLNPTLQIVARAVDESTEHKLIRAGATRVVSPFAVGGYVAANAVLNPGVLDTVDLANRAGALQVQIEELTLEHGSALCAGSLGALRMRAQYDLLIVAMRRKGGAVTFNPPHEITPEPGDTLIVMGLRRNLDRIELAAQPTTA